MKDMITIYQYSLLLHAYAYYFDRTINIRLYKCLRDRPDNIHSIYLHIVYGTPLHSLHLFWQTAMVDWETSHTLDD